MRRGVTTAPPSPQVIEVLFCLQAEQIDEAERLCQAMLDQEPARLDALQTMAQVLARRGRHGDAAEVLQTALRHHPNSAECRTMLGSTLRTLGRRAEALEQYHQALTLNPDLAEAHNNMGVLLHDDGKLEPAVACYRAALAILPGHVGALQNLASALRALGQPEEALATFETLLAFYPDNAYAALMVMHSKRELCRWSDHDQMTARLHEIAATQPGKVTPMLLFSCPVPPDRLLTAAEAYAGNFMPPTALPPVRATPKATGQKIRIGYFSADFREHVVATVIAEVLELHDRTAFDVVGYTYGPDDGSPHRRRIQAACTAFNDIRVLSDDDAARKIRDDRIDVLVDLNGYTGSIRHQVPARRPAPVQISWLGYPGTTGSPAIDYVIADSFTIPTGAEKYYSEKVIRLPGSSQPHDRTRPVAAPQSRAAYGLPENAFVFCSFNYPQKITPEIFEAWMSILKAAPESVLWLRADRPQTMTNLKTEAMTAGVDPRRLIFAPRTPDLADHLARHRVVDVALDTFPYNSHTTANDALWMGVPLVTLAGETFASRVAGGILHALNLPQLVANTVTTYRDIALRLATQPAELAAIKAQLAAARDTAAHFDTARFTRDLESGYRQAWKNRATGHVARHITVAG